jgi:TetR/AcrR family transcriptional repressor of bet genes
VPKKDASAIRKPELINATLECIVEAGIESITLEMVARRAGCSKGVAAYHFRSKQHLLVESFRAFLDSYQARLGDATVTSAQGFFDLLVDTALPPWPDPAHPGQAPQETAINVFPLPDARAISVSPGKKARLFVNFIARACQDAEIRALLADRYASDVRGIAAILEALSAALPGIPGAQDPVEAAYRFLALVYGLAFFRVSNFFPPGHSDNRHILIKEFGGSR